MTWRVGGGRATARDRWMSRNGVGWRKEGTDPGGMTSKDSEELIEDIDRVLMLKYSVGLTKHWGGWASRGNEGWTEG